MTLFPFRRAIRAATVALALAVSLLGGSSPGVAATPPPAMVFPQLDIQVLPEYDSDYPQTLVIVQGSLKNTGTETFKGEVVFHSPKGAQVNSVCELSGDPFTTANPIHTNELSLGRARVKEVDNHQEISWTPSREIKPGETFPLHMEFYYPGVEGGPDKKVNFSYDTTFGAEKVTLTVVQPARSSGYSADLKEISNSPAESNTTAHHYQTGPVKPGEPVKLLIAYNKPDNNRSLNTSAAPRSGGSSLGVKGNQAILWVALALVAGLGFLFFYGGTNSRRAGARAPRYGPKVKNAPGKSAGSARPTANPPATEQEKRKARRLLLDGKISEETYRELIRELDGE